MPEVERISNQMMRGFEGEAWHGPAVLEILADVDAALAAARPIPSAHSIWELALHLAATQEIILRRIQGERAGLTEEEFWPATPEPTEEAWQAMIARLRRQETELRQAVAAFPDERLGDPLMTGGTPAYDNFHGHVQHNIYHAGQIVMLKKAAAARRSQ
jgi:uncharacterized damage-inducible protein DinB